MKKVILASASPRRRELLHRLLDDFTVQADPTDEIRIPDEAPEDMVRRLALEKAEHVAETVEDGLVIGADTAVVLDDHVLGKPKDQKEAAEMLSMLSGREHQVMTGLAIVDAASKKACSEAEKTVVRFRSLTEDEIDRYIASGEPMDKAGAYGIQELGALFVEGICGDYFNVVGLPLCKLDQMMREEFAFYFLK